MNQMLSLCFKKWSLQLQQQKNIAKLLRGLANFYGRDFQLTKPGFATIFSPCPRPHRSSILEQLMFSGMAKVNNEALEDIVGGQIWRDK